MKLLHVDEQVIFRAGIRHIIQQRPEKIEFLEAASLETALPMLSTHKDIDLLLLNPLSFDKVYFAHLRERFPTTFIVIVSASEDPHHIKTALGAGAAGYIPKSATGTTFIKALELILAGGIYAPRIRQSRSHLTSRAGSNQSIANLTQRQGQVFALMAQGLSNKAIARKLHVSEATVKGHVSAILAILGVNNRVQAINRMGHAIDEWKLAS